MLVGNFHFRFSRFREIKNHDFENRLALPLEIKSFVRLEVARKPQIVAPETRFLSHLAERRRQTPLLLLDFSLGEIPVLVAVIEKQKLQAFVSPSINDNSRGNFFFHFISLETNRD